MKRTIICESILDNIEKSNRRSEVSGRYIPQPGEWDFCVMVLEATPQNELRIENILDAFSTEYRISHLENYMDMIDDLMDGGRLGKISEYKSQFNDKDALIVEFNAENLMMSVKCLFYIMIQQQTLLFFFDKDGKYAYIGHNTNACSIAFDLFLTGMIKLNDYITIKNAIYGIIWPDETFDIEHANELDVCMDRIKKKCQHVADSNRKKYHYNI